MKVDCNRIMVQGNRLMVVKDTCEGCKINPGTCALNEIDRQAAIDALEKVADMFPWRVPGNRDTYDRYNEAWNDAIGRAEMEIENMPSAQPKIVRCKDCKWKQGSECVRFAEVRPFPDDFCSRAERRKL